jgi:hypothetical protein
MDYLEPELKFTEELFPANYRGNILARFREKGFAVIPGAFQADTVDAYRRQIESLVIDSGHPSNPYRLENEDPILVYPAKAPRILDILKGCFMPWFCDPKPVLFHPAWNVRPSHPDSGVVVDWHKDADHEGRTNIHGYARPTVVHINLYFEDMTPEKGPTYVLPRSHRDPCISPYDNGREEPLLCDKGDAIVWDQRLWHRGSARTVEGYRIVAIFAYFAAPIEPDRWPVWNSQKAAYHAAVNDMERTLFGGPIDIG